MLLHRLSEDDAQVLVLRGRVGDSEAPSLRQAVAEALSVTSRGVVVDLSAAEAVGRAAVDALVRAAREAGGWPRPTLAVCGAPALLAERLEAGVAVHRDRRDALAHLDDHVPAERREVEVEHGPTGPRQAREAVKRWADDVRLGPLMDDVLLLVSELVTNAVRYGSPPVTVSVSADDRCVTVGVEDAASTRPVARDVPEDAEGGRGLLLLSLLSDEHGVRPEPPGKVVWASVVR